MDCERVLREVQILDTPFKEVVKKKSVAEKENNGLGVRYEEAYKSCIQRSSSLVQILERQDELASKLSVFQSLMVSLSATVFESSSRLRDIFLTVTE